LAAAPAADRTCRSKIVFRARFSPTSKRAAIRSPKSAAKGEVKFGYAAVAVVDVGKQTVEGGAEPRRSHGTASPGR
jgi:hypothetical protein